MRGIVAIFFLFLAWLILNMMGMVGPNGAALMMFKRLGLESYLRDPSNQHRLSSSLGERWSYSSSSSPPKEANPELCARVLESLNEASPEWEDLRFYEVRLLARHKGLKEHKYVKRLVQCFPRDPLGAYVLELDLFSGDMSDTTNLEGQDIQLQMSIFDYATSNKLGEATLALSLDDLDSLGPMD